MKRVFSLLLASMMLFALLCGCADTSTDDPTPTPTATDTGTPTPTEEAQPEDTLANRLAKYDKMAAGATPFRIWTSNIINNQLEIQQAPYEERNGDRINDSLFDRDEALKEYFDTDIEYTIVEPDAEFKLYDRASLIIATGDDEIDLVFGNMQVYAINFIQHEMILDMAEIDGIDLDAPWWNQTARRDLTVNDTVYFATGDITPRAIFSSFIMLFNQKLFRDMDIPFPYQTVHDGGWTIENMLGIIEDRGNSGGDDAWDLTDFYGFTNEGNCYPFVNGFDLTIVSLASGEPELVCDDDTSISKMDTLHDLFRTEGVFFRNISNQYDSLDLFRNDQALLTSQTASNLFMLSNMSSDYGILPLPKYDEDQENYYSFVNGYCATAVMVPISVKDEARVGTLTDAMASASNFLVTPAAYEKTLLSRQARDDESVEMLKITVAGSMYDMNYYFDWGGLRSAIESQIFGNGDFASTIESKRDAALEAALKTIEAFDR